MMLHDESNPAPEQVLDGLNVDDLPTDEFVRMIRVTVEPHLVDVVSDRFWQVGVRGVSESAGSDGRVEVSSSVGNEQEAIDRTVATFDSSWEWRVDEVTSAPADTWKQFAEPVWYRPGMVLLPAWIDVADVEPAEVITRVDPGSAFGLGDHPTTRSSMAMLADAIARQDPVPESVLDVGCGTGVLAVLAAQTGVTTVRAIDIAHAAVNATARNADLNDVVGRITVDTTPVADISGEFDIVVANILAPVLVAIAPDLRRVTAPTGSLIVSGILADRHDHVLDALAPLVPVRSVTDDGWITIELRH